MAHTATPATPNGYTRMAAFLRPAAWHVPQTPRPYTRGRCNAGISRLAACQAAGYSQAQAKAHLAACYYCHIAGRALPSLPVPV